MAARKSSDRVTFYRLILVGPEEMVHGFLTGLAIGAGHHAHYYYTDTDEFADDDSKVSRLEEWLKLKARRTQVAVDNGTRALLRKHRRRMVHETGIVLEEERRIRAASFTFHYEAYAARYRDEIDAVLQALPAGCRLLNHERDERVDPSARGAELYSPTHDYELKGSGTIRGRLDRVVEAYEILDSHPLIQPDPIALELA